jgi:hypothetical protein
MPYYRDKPYHLKKPMVYRLDESDRLLTRMVAWPRKCGSDGGYCYVVYGPGSYVELEAAYLRGMLTLGHEIIGGTSRAIFDLDRVMQGAKEAEGRIMVAFEASVRRVVARWYVRTYNGTIECFWVSASRDGRLSLHCVVNGLVFYSPDGKRRGLHDFYELVLWDMAIYSPEVDAKGMLDRGMESNVQLRMVGAVKRDCNVPLIPLQKDVPLHRYLLSHWRKEDCDEFHNAARLSDVGRAFLDPPETATLGVLGRLESRRTREQAEEDGDRSLVDFVDESQYSGIERPDGSVYLKREHAGVCLQCKREHERDNARLYVYNGEVRFKCYRAAETDPHVALGRVGVRDESVRLRNLEAQRQKDARKVLPGSLRFATRVNERYLKPLPDARDVAVLAPVGCGKTTVSIPVMKRYRKRLVISVRKTYSRSIVERLRKAGIGDVRLYLEEDEYGIDMEEGTLVIQLDSITRIRDLKGWFVCLDELESIVYHLNNDATMDGAKKAAVWEALRVLMRESIGTLSMDGYLSSRGVDFVRSMTLREPLIIENTYRPPRRRAIDLKSFPQFCRKAVEMVRIGKRLFIWLASKRKARELYELLLAEGKRVLFLREGMSVEEMRTLEDVNTRWLEYDVVICTPTLFLGVSFDVVNHFDHVFIYGSSHSSCPRDTAQALARVRHPTSSTLFYCIYERPVFDPVSRPDTIAGIRRQLEGDTGFVEDTAAAHGVRIQTLVETSAIVLATTILNRLEDHLAKRYFKPIFEHYLRDASFEISRDTSANMDEEVTGDEEEGTEQVEVVTPLLPPGSTTDPTPVLVAAPQIAPPVMLGDERIRYVDILPLARGTTIDELTTRMMRGGVSPMERAQLDRYCFSRVISGLNAALIARLYDEYWASKDGTKRAFLYALREERRGIVGAIAHFTRRAEGLPSLFVERTFSRGLVVRDIMRQLGIQSTGERVAITREVLYSLRMPANVIERMGLRATQGKGKATKDQLLLTTVNRVLGIWSGSRIVIDSTERSTIAGSKVYTADYHLEPVEEGIWECIAD